MSTATKGRWRRPGVDQAVRRVRRFHANTRFRELVDAHVPDDPIRGFDLHPIAYLEARARAERSTLRPLDRVRAALFEVGRYDITAGIGMSGEIEIDLDDDTPRDEDTARVVWRALFIADITGMCWTCFREDRGGVDYECGHELEWA